MDFDILMGPDLRSQDGEYFRISAEVISSLIYIIFVRHSVFNYWEELSSEKRTDTHTGFYCQFL